MKKLLALLFLLSTCGWAASPTILSNTDHAAGDIQAAITALSGPTIAVDQTCATGTSPPCEPTVQFVNPTTFVGYATNTGQTEYQAGTATVRNSAPYAVITQSSTGYSLSGYEQTVYGSLQSGNILYNMPYCNGANADPAPPIAMSTVLPNNAIPSGGAQCQAMTGVEFSITLGYKGFDTSSPSGTAASMAGVFAVMKQNHPTWTWGDIKGALRQTASNWATGYAANAVNGGVRGFGFGNINYDSANAIPNTGSIYLQASGMGIANFGYYAIITLYPFLTSRRSKEVVYIGGTWPAASSGNELTATQVTAAGGTKVIDDAGATGAQSFTYIPAASGNATFTVLTLDASGNASRVESFSQIAQSFVVGSACLDGAP